MNEEYLKNHAWCEINLDNLENNINEIKKIISKKTKIMAVLKANAYGHDLVIIAKKLNEIGIKDFAVATLEEGIVLRKNNIVGNILILGFTSIENIHLVIKYDLIQTVVSIEYAKELLSLKNVSDIKVHLKINTGMNRIGISYKNIGFIKELYNSKLNVLGIYSHLCVANSNKLSDKEFTKLQFERFNKLIIFLKSLGINVGVSHMQSSYGVLNYNEYTYDYVRIGILLYGLYNDTKTYKKINLNLLPVLELKARIVSVFTIDKGDTVGYGRCYKAKGKEKIASVSIGYVDGIPKSVENKNIKVKVNGKYATIIGKIYMDQLTINVSNIKDVKEGDIVTLFGFDKIVNAEKLCTKINTMTPELLGRLGSRLEYIIK